MELAAGLPGPPRRSVVTFLEGGEQGVVVEPGRGDGEHALMVARELTVALHAALEVVKRLFQQSALVGDDLSVVGQVGGKGGRAGDIALIEQAHRHQSLRADEVDVTREGRRRGVGRVAVARPREGHDLPEGLAGHREEVDEPVGLFAEIADAERPGKGGGMQENAAGPIESHDLSGASDGGLVRTQERSTSATLHAWATQPRGVYGSTASKTSLIEPMQASSRCGTKPSRKRRAPA